MARLMAPPLIIDYVLLRAAAGPFTKRAKGWNGEWRPCRGYCPDPSNHSASNHTVT